MCRLKFLKVLIFGEIKKLKKIKKIKTNEVCQQKYSPFSKIICNDNAAINTLTSYIYERKKRAKTDIVFAPLPS